MILVLFTLNNGIPTLTLSGQIYISIFKVDITAMAKNHSINI